MRESMILKIIGSALTISSCAAIGMYFSLILKKRIEELRELANCFTVIRGDIRYAKTTLPESLLGVGERTNGVFRPFFLGVAQQLISGEGNSFQQIWEEQIEKQLEESCLTKKDKSILNSLGETLGYLDSELQLDTLEIYIQRLKEEIQDSSKVVLEKTKIYSLLGVMGGIFVTIILL